MKKTIISLFLSVIAINSFADTSNKTMDFDLSQNMLSANSKNADFNIEIYKDNDVLLITDVAIVNGKVIPITQLDTDETSESYNNAFTKENGNASVKNKDVTKKNILIQFVWHTNGKEQNWIQFFIEDFDNNLKMNETTAVVKQTKEEALKMEPIVNKRNTTFTLPIKQNKDSIINWNGYKFKINMDR